MQQRSCEKSTMPTPGRRIYEEFVKKRPALLAAAVLFGCTQGLGALATQAQDGTWQPDIEVRKSAPAAKTAKPAPSGTTVIERKDEAVGDNAELRLVALLTVDGQQIDQGLIWRVYQPNPATAGKPKLVTENREASPSLKLQPGDYTINAAFGRAHLTRRITLKPGSSGVEQFVLNAGGFRLNASITGKPASEGSVSYAIYTDDRDQLSNRALVMAGVKPNLVIRLNAGIYHVVSTYGDANAKVEADVTVEAGKLTEASVTHQAAKAAFKLVNHAGGEALPDTHWTIQTLGGEAVKESVGALPSHVLAPGDYRVIAKSGGRMFQRTFAVKDGDMVNVEVLADGGSAEVPPADQPALGGEEPAAELNLDPSSLEIKSP